MSRDNTTESIWPFFAAAMLFYFIVHTLFAGVLVLFGMGWKDAYIVGLFLMWAMCSVGAHFFDPDTDKAAQRQEGGE